MFRQPRQAFLVPAKARFSHCGCDSAFVCKITFMGKKYGSNMAELR